MKSIKKIEEDIYYLGGADRRIQLFENVYPVPEGVTYNSYLVKDDKTALLDTVDCAIADEFFENLASALEGRQLDYVIVNHMEPDHAATLGRLLAAYPQAVLVTTQKALVIVEEFFGAISNQVMLVKEGDRLSLGKRTFRFILAPMVHWPEVMMTYEEYGQILFSADAFGSFGASDACLFAKDEDFSEYRRYYCNIVGKYGAPVSSVLKKASALPIAMLCPLHGKIWKGNFDKLLEKYVAWSSYAPEEKGVLIVYASVYGHTKCAAELLASLLAERGVTVRIYDVSKTHPSYLIAEAFRFSHIVCASITYNAGIFVNMEHFLSDLKAHGLKNRTCAVIENGGWAPASGKLMQELLSSVGTVLPQTVTMRGALKESAPVEALADAIAETV